MYSERTMDFLGTKTTKNFEKIHKITIESNFLHQGSLIQHTRKGHNTSHLGSGTPSGGYVEQSLLVEDSKRFSNLFFFYLPIFFPVNKATSLTCWEKAKMQGH